MKLTHRKLCCIGGALLLGSLTALADTQSTRAPPWPDTYLARVEALALLQTLDADLLSHDSATLTLERWCGAHRLAAAPRIVAERVAGVDKQPTADQRQELGIDANEPVRYRRVKLLCGTWVLSEADNWYVPSRLTPDMNKTLETTNTPFGKAVQALHFQRHTLSSRLLWLPLPDGWEMSAPGKTAGAVPLTIPPAVLENKAVLSLPDGTPFSEVVETYSSNVLAFAPP
jgi:chorismate-pyruvate lyase